MKRHIKKILLLNKMFDIFLYDLPINVVRANPLRIYCIIETVKRGITIRTVSLTVREKSNKNIILNGGSDKQASTAESKGC